MDEVGGILREAREARGLSYAEVQEELRITPKFLQALEEGAYDVLPTPVHVRGYLRNYARFLNLDPQPLLDRYEVSRNHQTVAVSAETISPDTPLPSRSDQPFFTPVNMELDAAGSGRAESMLRIVIIIALVVAIGLVASRFLIMGDDREFNPIEAVSAILDAPAEDAPFEFETPAVTGSMPLTSTSRNNRLELPEATATRPRPALPAVMDVIELRVEVTERTWLQITIDDEIVYEGLARTGDLFEYFEDDAAEKSALLKTGNAIGLFVTVNGVEIGRLGDRGEVVEEFWQTTP